MQAAELLSRMKSLLVEPPDLDKLSIFDSECEDWVAKADALLSVVVQQFTYDTFAMSEFRSNVENLRNPVVSLRPLKASKNNAIGLIRRNFERLRLAVPSSHDGAFIPVGSEFEAYSEISRIAAESSSELLIVDPYMDGKILTEFLQSIEGKVINLLSDENTVRPDLKVASAKWKGQYGTNRPLELRLSPTRTLHDRLIVGDQKQVWALTQSFKDFAKRSTGSILRVDPETASLKIEAYKRLWNAARVVT